MNEKKEFERKKGEKGARHTTGKMEGVGGRRAKKMAKQRPREEDVSRRPTHSQPTNLGCDYGRNGRPAEDAAETAT
jgi:hypothetical protein